MEADGFRLNKKTLISKRLTNAFFREEVTLTQMKTFCREENALSKETNVDEQKQ